MVSPIFSLNAVKSSDTFSILTINNNNHPQQIYLHIKQYFRITIMRDLPLIWPLKLQYLIALHKLHFSMGLHSNAVDNLLNRIH